MRAGCEIGVGPSPPDPPRPPRPSHVLGVTGRRALHSAHGCCTLSAQLCARSVGRGSSQGTARGDPEGPATPESAEVTPHGSRVSGAGIICVSLGHMRRYIVERADVTIASWVQQWMQWPDDDEI